MQIDPGDRTEPPSRAKLTLGSPSTTATFDNGVFYYISATAEQSSILDPKESTAGLAVRFNQNNRVESFANYGLEDGRSSISARATRRPAARNITILGQLFGGIGTFTPSEGPPGKGKVGP